MTDHESKLQSERVAKYNFLQQEKNRILSLINKVTEGWPEGPHGQGPFTGNTRESRVVLDLKICFSKTRGGAPETDTSLLDLKISAWNFGKFIESELRSDLAVINAEIKKL